MEEMAHKGDPTDTGEVRKDTRKIQAKLNRNNTETIQPGYNAFLQIEWKVEKETIIKIAPIAESPFSVLCVDSVAKTVFIQRLE